MIKYLLLILTLDKVRNKGFSLIELVVVVSVLSILSAIAIPSFLCFQRKAKAAAALTAIKQIQTECSLDKFSEETVLFTASKLDSYSIQPEDSNSCKGSGTDGLIRMISNDESTLPSFYYSSRNNLLSFRFKNQSGINLKDSLSLICSDTPLAKLVQAVSYPKEIDDTSYCISHGKIGGGTKSLCGGDAQHASEKHAHWHCQEADSNGDWRHVVECNQVKKDYGCDWNSEEGNFDLSKDGKTCAEQMNEKACEPSWTRRVVCLRFGIWPSAYRACLRQTSGCTSDYKDPRWSN